MQPNDEIDLRSLVEQSEKLQQQMMEAQLAMSQAELVGRGGEEVSIVMSATGEPRAVKIDPAVVDPNDVAGLERLVLTALEDLQAQQTTMARNMLSPVGDLFQQIP